MAIIIFFGRLGFEEDAYFFPFDSLVDEAFYTKQAI